MTQEGFGKDAVALPVDEQAGSIAVGEPPAVALVDRTARCRDRRDRLAAWPPSSPMRRSKPATTRRRPGRKRFQLMTVHSAKGLEFDVRVHHRPRGGPVPHENSLSDHEGLEEERRLMYVAITRARKRLYLSSEQTRMLHGQTRYNVKSRFFDELPEGALQVDHAEGAGLRLRLRAQLPGGLERAARAWARSWARASVAGRASCGGAEGRPPPTASHCAAGNPSFTPSSAKA